MLATIAAIRANTYRLYSGTTKKTNPAYQPKSNESAGAREERKNCMSFWLAHSSNARQVGTSLLKLEQDAKNKYCQTWGLKIKDVWPEMNAIPPHIASRALARAALNSRDSVRPRLMMKPLKVRKRSPLMLMRVYRLLKCSGTLSKRNNELA